MEYVPTFQDLLGVFIMGIGVGVMGSAFFRRDSDTRPKKGSDE